MQAISENFEFGLCAFILRRLLLANRFYALSLSFFPRLDWNHSQTQSKIDKYAFDVKNNDSIIVNKHLFSIVRSLCGTFDANP